MNIRILHVVGDSRFGGASLGIIRLARFWKSLHWEVEVLATDPEFCRIAQLEGVHVNGLDCIWREIRPWRDLQGLWKLFRYLRGSDYTIVHTHTTKAGFVGRIAAWMAGVPVILHTAHGFAFHEASARWKIQFYCLLERMASWDCQRVIMVSRFHEQWGRQLRIAASEKIIAIPNGIPETPRVDRITTETIRRRWGASAGQIVLFTPGRLAPEKGLEDVIDAVALLKPGFSGRLLLVIAGEGVLRPGLEQRVKERGLRPEVRFLGFQSNVPELLAASDIVVLPTWREGLSIALLEAMAQGCAIVTTTIGSNLEATGEGAGALLVPPMQPRELAAAIGRLAVDRVLCEALGASARKLYLRHYTHGRMLDGYHKLYVQLLKELQSARSVSPVLSSLDR
ncbi:MAG TPA: glycosyltransferase family 4 protein [Bryobacteraceae bacterium]|nr:glycosyltransferase family 4 protein [Bryobacteraceae bacterium]